jgi:hypothetical protein
MQRRRLLPRAVDDPNRLGLRRGVEPGRPRARPGPSGRTGSQGQQCCAWRAACRPASHRPSTAGPPPIPSAKMRWIKAPAFQAGQSPGLSEAWWLTLPWWEDPICLPWKSKPTMPEAPLVPSHTVSLPVDGHDLRELRRPGGACAGAGAGAWPPPASTWPPKPATDHRHSTPPATLAEAIRAAGYQVPWNRIGRSGSRA